MSYDSTVSPSPASYSILAVFAFSGPGRVSLLASDAPDDQLLYRHFTDLSCVFIPENLSEQVVDRLCEIADIVLDLNSFEVKSFKRSSASELGLTLSECTPSYDSIVDHLHTFDVSKRLVPDPIGRTNNLYGLKWLVPHSVDYYNLASIRLQNIETSLIDKLTGMGILPGPPTQRHFFLDTSTSSYKVTAVWHYMTAVADNIRRLDRLATHAASLSSTEKLIALGNIVDDFEV